MVMEYLNVVMVNNTKAIGLKTKYYVQMETQLIMNGILENLMAKEKL